MTPKLILSGAVLVWAARTATLDPAQDSREGWLASLRCQQPGADRRLDLFQPCRGPRQPPQEAPPDDAAVPAVRLFDTGQTSTGPLAELDKLAHRIDERSAARRAAIKDPAQAAAMREEFRRTVLHNES